MLIKRTVNGKVCPIEEAPFPANDTFSYQAPRTIVAQQATFSQRPWKTLKDPNGLLLDQGKLNVLNIAVVPWQRHTHVERVQR